MCCRPCGVRLLPHVNALLTLVCSAVVCWCGALYWCSEQAGAGAGAGAGAEARLPDELVVVPALWAACAIATLILVHVAFAAQSGVTKLRRAALIMFSCLMVLLVVGEGAAAGWGGVVLRDWLRGAGAGRALRADAALRGWMRPAVAVLAADMLPLLPEEELRTDVLAVLCACALVPALQLLAAVCAGAAARSRGKRPASSLRRSSSMFYFEAPAEAPNLPVHEPAAYQ